MISRIPFLSFLLLFSLVAPASATEGIFPYRCEKHVLSNGLTVLMIPMHGSGLVSYFSVVRTGSRDEVEPGHSGFAHFFEHIMFRGTKKNPGPVYDRILTSLGAHANAHTSDDLTAFHLTFAKEDLQRVIDIESDRFQNLSYSKPAFQTEAGAVYGEYRIGAANPGFAIHEKLHDLAYDAHTYKHTTIGFEADVKAMPKAYRSRRFRSSSFRRSTGAVLNSSSVRWISSRTESTSSARLTTATISNSDGSRFIGMSQWSISTFCSRSTSFLCNSLCGPKANWPSSRAAT